MRRKTKYMYVRVDDNLCPCMHHTEAQGVTCHRSNKESFVMTEKQLEIAKRIAEKNSSRASFTAHETYRPDTDEIYSAKEVESLNWLS